MWAADDAYEEVIDGARIGLEIDGDIFVQVNLDQIYNNRIINLQDFFEELIYKRLRHCGGTRMEKLFRHREDPDRPVESFLELLFDDKSGFEELITASGGIPRDFINRFEQVAAAYEHSIEQEWKSHAIRDVIMRHSIRRIDEHVNKDAFLACIYREIGSIVTKNDNRVFLIPRPTDSKLSEAIETLFASRLIHKLDLVAIPERARSKYDVYFIDYGAFLDRTRSNHHRIRNFEAIWPLDPDASDVEMDKFVVNVQTCER